MVKVLEEFLVMFIEENGGWLNVKKILVVIIDNKLDSFGDDIEDVVVLVREVGIWVILVGFDRVDRGELDKMIVVEEDVLILLDSDMV